MATGVEDEAEWFLVRKVGDPGNLIGFETRGLAEAMIDQLCPPPSISLYEIVVETIPRIEYERRIECVAEREDADLFENELAWLEETTMLKIVPLRLRPFLLHDPALVPDAVQRKWDDDAIEFALDMFSRHPDTLDWPGREKALKEITGMENARTSMSCDRLAGELLTLRLARLSHVKAGYRPLEPVCTIADWEGPDDEAAVERAFGRAMVEHGAQERGDVGWRFDGVKIWRIALGVS